uniref:YY1-associated factor 2-like n=1 Tax=Hirondellea gigas TaxID=1518452 RepID=A0A2P2I365_9CRUS
MKRSNKEDIMWDCSVCTYRNSPEAFKCLMCDVRKGTSTRKPRLNAELVAAQVAQVIPPVKVKKERPHKDRKVDGTKHTFKGRPRLKNVDRSTAEHNAVTVNNVTVIITEFQLKQKANSNASGGAASSGHITAAATGSSNGVANEAMDTSTSSVGRSSAATASSLSNGVGSGSSGATAMSSKMASSSNVSESNKHSIKANNSMHVDKS